MVNSLGFFLLLASNVQVVCDGKALLDFSGSSSSRSSREKWRSGMMDSAQFGRRELGELGELIPSRELTYLPGDMLVSRRVFL